MNLWPFSKKSAQADPKQKQTIFDFPIPSAASSAVNTQQNSTTIMEALPALSRQEDRLEDDAPTPLMMEVFNLPTMELPGDSGMSCPAETEGFSERLSDAPWQVCLTSEEVATPPVAEPTVWSPLMNDPFDSENNETADTQDEGQSADWSALSPVDLLPELSGMDPLTCETSPVLNASADDCYPSQDETEHSGEWAALSPMNCMEDDLDKTDLAACELPEAAMCIALEPEDNETTGLTLNDPLTCEQLEACRSADAYDFFSSGCPPEDISRLVCSTQESMTWELPLPTSESGIDLKSHHEVEDAWLDEPAQHELYDHLVQLSTETFHGQAQQTNRQINNLVAGYFSKSIT